MTATTTTKNDKKKLAKDMKEKKNSIKQFSHET